ncbi:MAG: DNRLRE domain-containing protein, partial [Erysipelotrichaceae bacterium]|nr:DNRLRE domain-containing protein [Erysipelotrichaceae bacterium]
ETSSLDSVFTERMTSTVQNTETAIPCNEDTIVNELNDRNDEYSRRFYMTDGTYTAVVYPFEVNEYINDRFVPINHQLNQTEEGYTDGYVVFPYELSDGIEQKDAGVKWRVANGYNAFVQVSKTDESVLSPHSISRVVTYEGAFLCADLSYQYVGHQLKEYIVLKEYTGQESYDFLYDGTAEVLDDHSVQINDCILSVPYMTDGNGVFSDEVKISVRQSEEGSIVSVVPSSDWLSDEERVYPVIIDPTLESVQRASQSNNTSVYSSSPDSHAMYQYGAMYVGKEASSYEKLRGVYTFRLPELRESERVIQSTVNLTQLNYYGSGSVTVKAHQITSDLSLATLTWNRLKNRYDTVVLDAQVVNSSTKMKTVPFDITSAVQDWYMNGNNYGLAFTSDNESGDYKYATFFTARYPGLTNSQYPTVYIQYRNQEGISDSMTYETCGNETMGTVYVSHYNGNLVYEYHDLSMNGNYLPVTVTHYFSQSSRNTNSEFGKGFTINYRQRIEPCEIPGYEYVCVDSDGTKHYMALQENSTDTYEEEDGTLCIRMTQDGYVMEEDTLQIQFDVNGNLVRIHDTKNDRTQSIGYTGNLITSVTDGADRVVTLHYNNGLLDYIEDPALRRITYTYDTENRLIKITRPDNTEVHIAYTETGMINKITDIDGSS